MMGDYHVQFSESEKVRFPRATQLVDNYSIDTQGRSSYAPTVKKQCLVNASFLRGH